MMQSEQMVKPKSHRNNLKRVRQNEGISKATLAREADLSERHISRIEAEELVPLIETANRIKNAINRMKTSNKADYALKAIFPNRKES
jgi:DNA-binding XRE family transcriptional regulator